MSGKSAAGRPDQKAVPCCAGTLVCDRCVRSWADATRPAWGQKSLDSLTIATAELPPSTRAEEPAYDEAELSVTFPFASSQGRDREGNFVEIRGIGVEAHKFNPVVYLDGGKWHPLPVGVTEHPTTREYTVYSDDDRGLLYAKVYLDKGSAVAREAFRLFKAGLLRGGSFAHRPIEVKRLKADAKAGHPRAGLYVARCELLSIGLTAMPHSAELVAKAMADGVEGEPLSWQAKAMLAADRPVRKTRPTWAPAPGTILGYTKRLYGKQGAAT
jgi:hypothetical protein